MATSSLLISFAGYPYTPSSLLPDNGLANLAACLMNSGHKTTILDLNTLDMIKRLFPPAYHRKILPLAMKTMSADSRRKLTDMVSLLSLRRSLRRFQNREFYRIGREIVELVKREKVDFVGLKLWNGDGFTASLIIARMLKRHLPHLPLFAGGPHVDIFRETILKVTQDFDALVYGEGEETITMLAEYVEGKRNLKDIPNLIFGENGRVIVTPIKRVKDLNKLPYPFYDEEIYPAMRGNQKIKMIVLDESRGCPNKCHFCIHPVKSGTLRTKSYKRIVGEIEHIMQRYGVRVFRFAGSSTPGYLLEKVAEEIIKRGLRVKYSTFGHFQTSKEEVFSLLRKSGCYSIFFGIESGSQMILDKGMNKRVSVEKMKKVIQSCRAAGIFTVGSLIFPAPFETEETKEATLKFLKEARVDSLVVQFPGIYPGTEWAEKPEKFNFEMVKSTYKEKMMNYKFKPLFPPRFWYPLPYKVNGKDFKEFSQETESFIEILEKEGIPTGIPDDFALLSYCAEVFPKEFRDRNRLNFFTGDYTAIGEEVEKINLSITKGIV